MKKFKRFLMLLMACLYAMPVLLNANQEYVVWTNDNDEIRQALNGFNGNAVRGRQLVIDQDKGNCLSCHHFPIPEEIFHGDVGPDLHGVATRLTEGQLRLRVVDEKLINPLTIMPGYYRHPEKLRLVANEYAGKTMLTAQEIEDVVAYLMTLK